MDETPANLPLHNGRSFPENQQWACAWCRSWTSPIPHGYRTVVDNYGTFSLDYRCAWCGRMNHRVGATGAETWRVAEGQVPREEGRS